MIGRRFAFNVTEEMTRLLPIMPDTFEVADAARVLADAGFQLHVLERAFITMALYHLERAGRVVRFGRTKHNAIVWRKANIND